MTAPVATEEYRLPRTVVPEHYRLTLTPDLAAATFSGEETIRVTIVEPTSTILLNAIEITIQQATIRSGGRTVEASVDYDEAEERVILTLGETIQPGPAELDLTFTGILNDKLHGFYRSTIKDQNGVEQVIAVTQFESTDARRAFPCWDEPDFKAIFEVRLVVPENLTAISNGIEVGVTPVEGGKRAVQFAPTMRMSTYLVAFVVGPFEATDPVVVRGTPVRVVAPIGKGHLSKFALGAAEASLNYFSDYFAIPYPADKLDLIAIPDFSFGAMENLGAVTFRETALLVDEATATRGELERIADVVAHEIAHMWFGDLVTMKWWNGIWLNEAFATFMEVKAVDHWKPEWNRWDSFSLDRSAAMGTDALHTTRPVEYTVRRPEESTDMFDVLTYEKGGSVLRMLEQYLGEEPFRQGIASYLKTNSYGNTETTDLWDAIETASGQPVRQIMDSWIFQAGFPLVSAAIEDGGLSLRQQIFKYLPDEATEADRARRWQVPVVARAAGSDGTQELRVLVNRDRAWTELPPGADRVVVNAGGSGFYRVGYSSNLIERFKTALESLSVVERYNLVDDTWAATRAQMIPVADFLSLTEAFQHETDKTVWLAVLGGLGALDRAIDADLKPRLAARVRDLVAPTAARLGWDPAPGETDLVRQLRGTMISALGTMAEDPATQAEARRRYESYLADRSSLDPNVVPAVVGIVAYTGNAAEYEAFWDRYRNAPTPQEKNRYLYALADFRDATLLRRTLEAALTDEVRTQDAAFVIAGGFRNEIGGELTWEFVKANWSTILGRLAPNMPARLAEGLVAVVDRKVADDAARFFAENPLKEGARLIPRILERQRIAVRFKEQQATALRAALGG